MGRLFRADDVEDPQPRWAQGRVIGHRNRSGSHADIRLEEMPLGYGTEGKRYEGLTFKAGKRELPPSPFSRCTFIRCAFVGPWNYDFRYCRLIDCNFLCGNALGTTEVLTLVFEWCELRGGVGGGVLDDRSSGVFSRVHLLDTRFDNCLLDRIGFDSTVEFERTRIRQTKGLPSCMGLDQVKVRSAGAEELNRDLEDVPVAFLDRHASWERLRTIGSLPLFGTSLSVLIAIPVVFFLLAFYNEQLRDLQERAEINGLTREIVGFVYSLNPVPLPALSLWLLLSTLLLGVGATLFSLLCPSRIREFTFTRWTDELGQSALRYLPLSWSRRWARAIAAPCYVVGGGGTLLILIIKLWNAGVFIIQNASLVGAQAPVVSP